VGRGHGHHTGALTAPLAGAPCAERRASQSRLDARGKDVGPFVMAAGQPDFAAFFGAANAQACARCLLWHGRLR
jgi:hypothetical protein